MALYRAPVTISEKLHNCSHNFGLNSFKFEGYSLIIGIRGPIPGSAPSKSVFTLDKITCQIRIASSPSEMGYIYRRKPSSYILNGSLLFSLIIPWLNSIIRVSAYLFHIKELEDVKKHELDLSRRLTANGPGSVLRCHFKFKPT